MEWFIAVVVVAALGVAAVVAAGGLGSMPADPTRDVFRQDLPADRSLTGEDLRRLRFGVTVRGYAMNQVDDVLDRLSGELVERDRRIADLESRLAGQPVPTSAPLSTAGVGSAPEVGRPSTSPTEQPADEQ
ncbi:MAG: DivIVA domain-containing protein [Microlunatus sp.]